MLQINKILIIQTAFIGDAILATALVEKWKEYYPTTDVDVLVRKGNESIFEQNPHIRYLYTWDKKKAKWHSWFQLLRQVRSRQYDVVFNCQRFFSMAALSLLSSAKVVSGFATSPLSFWFDKRAPHSFFGEHETFRNQRLIADFTDTSPAKPKLYFSREEMEKVELYRPPTPYLTIAPSSVWFTKQWPTEIWVQFINGIPADIPVFLLGGPTDIEKNQQIKKATRHPNLQNLAGVFALKESALFMQHATLNIVHDSAPLHLCSAVNAPVIAIFLSTVPAFGYGPLSDTSYVIETETPLECRPCGLHGKKACPKKHFDCARTISFQKIYNIIYQHFN